MSHRLNLLILLITAFLVDCSSKSVVNSIDKTAQDQLTYVDSVFQPEYSFKTLKISKALFRLDYKGELRTLRTNVLLSLDSLLFISINTPIGVTVASMKATVKDVTFTNNQDKISYQFGYDYLSNRLGVELDFNDLQTLLLGYPNYDNLQQLAKTLTFNDEIPQYKIYTSTINKTIDKTNFEYLENFKISLSTSKLHEYYLIDNENIIKFSSTYVWKDKFNTELPKSIKIQMTYDQEPLEIEFDYKSYIYDEPIIFFVDSSLYVQHLTEI